MFILLVSTATAGKIFRPDGLATKGITKQAATLALKTATLQIAQGIPFPLVRLTAPALPVPKPPLTALPTA